MSVAPSLVFDFWLSRQWILWWLDLVLIQPFKDHTPIVL